MLVELNLKNKTVKTWSREIMIDLGSVEDVVCWYCSFCSGDDIVVKVNGKKQKINGDWGIDGGVKL